ncbi:glutaredoxin domain protein [Fimicolochytrium jonesii]|uniref:glutaredoxin domain protein n=1 Tax=Fimicolochytrium jonesii TaxID=1396493 RepID=UPI0022FED994|nr:glutaredoxin domain protein [Fimicolochytrium jonesii]KAI8821319.1 glutaredoxin domain protein [Fimicolochytrium jonesii]
MPPPRLAFTLFTKQYCGLCEHAKEALELIQLKKLSKTPFTVTEIDIEKPEHKPWLRKYMYHVPVLHLGDQMVARHRIEEGDILRILREVEGGERGDRGE